ncbi:glucosyl-glycerol phosphate synthase [Streptomyces sp. 1114.5]|uniref:trehalose-6-phosphate synthase n=1 Tax=Streptomyces sp. 1114.5 TaxID=1938830 RepID=UPI000EADFB79|nr:trehalose-6-phosphate synthase [Streptomyces sp. 1114.5]RKT08743.1 glucosyl-glycerol phosphate synthase [Streptomyces sp. 1114.5]
MSRILVTDLDGTLLGGAPEDRRRLRDALNRHPEVTVVFATGRGLTSIRKVLRDPLVPRPRWIIADVGATVLDGTDFSTVEPLQEQLRAGWPGPERVRAALRRFPGLTYQHGVIQDGRCSFHLAPEHLTGELTAAVEALGCGWTYSADRFFDVLPPTASKGGALRALADKLDWSAKAILVAGDSLNDLSLFRLGTHGVVVAGGEPALLAAVADDPLIHRPHQQGAAGILAALRTLGWVATVRPEPEPRPSLVVGYHRPPLRWAGDSWQPPTSPNGILPTLTSAFTGGLPGGIWVTARPGGHPEAAREQSAGPPLSLVPLTTAEWSGYFHHACKEILWPVLMSEPGRSVFDDRAWAEYRTVNARFADHIGTLAAPGATVWLHDYNLWLVPGLLRTARPDLRTGLFHHTPFPPADVFATLPVAAELRASLACLDWAGFHTTAFADHFRHALTGLPHPPRIEVCPLGVDRPAIEALARTRTPPPRSGTGRLVLSVERLDYAKAPVQKVDAIARLLAQRPDLRERLTFRLVCPPPEPGLTAYDTTRALLEQRIDEVNDAWQTPDWRPVDYLPRSLSFAEVVDEYLAADVLWVTSLQDGMNLTAKEFVAAQAALPSRHAAGPGVLVLSRHAGAAAELGDAALLTDPRSPDDLTAVLAKALALTPTERRTRMHRLATLLGHERPADWATRIIHAIRRPDPAS